MTKPFKQFDIYWVNLEPTVGAETRKNRPCVILQSNTINENSRTVIVAPFLPDHKSWPFAVNVTPTKKNGLDKNRHINVKQLRAIDIARIGNRQGNLGSEYIESIETALDLIFDPDC